MSESSEWDRFDERNSGTYLIIDGACVVLGVFEQSGKWYWCLHDAKHGFIWDPSLPPLPCGEPSETEEEARVRAEGAGKRWLEGSEAGE